MALQEECSCPEVDERVEWIYTYGDLVTLLLAFFILLFASCKREDQKFRAISEALRGSIPASPHMFEGAPQFMENIESKLKKSQAGEESSITVDDRGITVSFNDTAFFQPGSAIILEKGKRTIEKFARVLHAIPNTVVIEGHTDNVPIKTKKFPSNWELSAARAGTVARLLEQFEISSDRLEIAAYGSTRPKVKNKSPELRALNRRIDILIKPNDGPLKPKVKP